jgi:hypothetical protein
MGMPVLRPSGIFSSFRNSPTRRSRYPKHQQVPALEDFDTQDREVRRLDQVAVGQQFPLDFVELIVFQSHRRKDRSPVLVAVLANDDIPSAQILKVVRKRAQRLDDRIRIPARLVLDPIPFDRSLPQQRIQINWQLTSHGLPSSKLCVFAPWRDIFGGSRKDAKSQRNSGPD